MQGPVLPPPRRIRPKSWIPCLFGLTITAAVRFLTDAFLVLPMVATSFAHVASNLGKAQLLSPLQLFLFEPIESLGPPLERWIVLSLVVGDYTSC